VAARRQKAFRSAKAGLAQAGLVEASQRLSGPVHAALLALEDPQQLMLPPPSKALDSNR
jgi:hypothetical protein